MEDILATLLVFSFAAFVCTGIYKLIKMKNEGGNEIDGETFNRLAEAFVKHRNDIDERVQNLEAIMAAEEINYHNRVIETPEKKQGFSDNLQQKNRVQS